MNKIAKATERGTYIHGKHNDGHMKRRTRKRFIDMLNVINKITKSSHEYNDGVTMYDEIINKVYENNIYKCKSDIRTDNEQKYINIYKRDTDYTKKHLPQEMSIIMHIMDTINSSSADPDKIVILDIGGGNGIIAYFLSELFGFTIIVIDQYTPKHAIDFKKTVKFFRLEKNIEDTKIKDINSIDHFDKDITDCDVFIIGKHLCGAGTDHAIKWSIEKKLPVYGFVIATCCFHKSLYEEYVYKEYLDSINIDSKDFDIISRTTQWNHYNDPRCYRKKYSKLMVEILNSGRLEYIKKNGFKSCLIQFIDSKITIKNIMIKAYR
jgi:hypothetical protein